MGCGVCVCMYVRMHACMQVCMYMCMYRYMYGCIYVNKRKYKLINQEDTNHILISFSFSNFEGINLQWDIVSTSLFFDESASTPEGTFLIDKFAILDSLTYKSSSEMPPFW